MDHLQNGDQKTTAKIFDCELELTVHNEPIGMITQTKTQLWIYVKTGLLKSMKYNWKTKNA